MKKHLSLIGSTLLFSLSCTAYAGGSYFDGSYVSFNVGVADINDSDAVSPVLAPGSAIVLGADNGTALSLAAGYKFGNMRVEGELAYQKNDLDSISIAGSGNQITGDASSSSLLINGYYDFKNKSKFTPFVTAGVGIANIDISNIDIVGVGPMSDSADDSTFVYQVGAGVSYPISKTVDFDLKYRYFEASDPDFPIMTAEYASHNFYVGLRNSF